MIISSSRFSSVVLLIVMVFFVSVKAGNESMDTAPTSVTIAFGPEINGVSMGGLIKEQFAFGDDIEISLMIRYASKDLANSSDPNRLCSQSNFSLLFVDETDLRNRPIESNEVSDTWHRLDSTTFGIIITFPATIETSFEGYSPRLGPPPVTHYTRPLPLGLHRAVIYSGSSFRNCISSAIPLTTQDFPLTLLDDSSRYKPLTVWFPTVIRIDPKRVYKPEVVDMDSIVVLQTKGFGVYQEIQGMLGMELTSRLTERDLDLSKFGNSFVPRDPIDSISFCLRIHESSHGVGHMGIPRGYGHRIILEHEWYIKYIYDSTSTDQ